MSHVTRDVVGVAFRVSVDPIPATSIDVECGSVASGIDAHRITAGYSIVQTSSFISVISAFPGSPSSQSNIVSDIPALSGDVHRGVSA